MTTNIATAREMQDATPADRDRITQHIAGGQAAQDAGNLSAAIDYYAAAKNVARYAGMSATRAAMQTVIDGLNAARRAR
jgi:hypothetical protein